MFKKLKGVLFGDPRASAARKGDIPAMQALLDEGQDINGALKGSDPALFHAAAAGQLEMVQFLLDQGADVNHFTNAFKLTPLMMAASFGNEALVRLLIEKGANVNARDRAGNTPLDKAEEPTLGHDGRTTITPEDKAGTIAVIKAAGGKSGAA